MNFTIGEVVSILALVIAILYPTLQWVFWVDKRLSKIENNPLLRASERKTLDFWLNILSGFEKKGLSDNPGQDMVRRREGLTAKLKDDTITLQEAEELYNILNKELEEAKDANDALVVLAILFLIGVVTAAIAVLSK